MLTLKLEGNSRAEKLLDKVDKRYFQFVEKLPTAMAVLARQGSTYAGEPGDISFAGFAYINPILVGAPWLFWEIAQDLDDATFLQIATAGAFLGAASILLDHLVDGQSEHPEITMLLQLAIVEQGIRQLQELFPPESAFWNHFDRLSGEHKDALATEAWTQSNADQLTLERFLITARGKVTPAVIAVAALAETLDRPAFLSAAEASLKDAISAGQLHHDIRGWKQDRNQGHLTYFLRQLAPADDWAQKEWPPEETLQSRLTKGWLDVEHFKLAKTWMERSDEQGQILGCQAWNDYVAECNEIIEQTLLRLMAHYLVRLADRLPSVGA